MDERKKVYSENRIKTAPDKYFQIFFLLLFITTLGGCAFLHPYQQLEYSNVSQVKMFEGEMNAEDAINVLKVYVKDHLSNDEIRDIQKEGEMLPGMETPVEKGTVIAFRKEQENTVVNEASLSYETVPKYYRLIETDVDFTMAIIKEGKKTLYARKFLSRGESVPFLMEYKDVKKIKLYKYKEFFNPKYEVNLYDEFNNNLFYFKLPCKGNGQQEIYKLLAALSILMPHVEEDYDENDTLRVWT